MRTILAIDPGTIHSAMIWWDGKEIIAKHQCDNAGVIVAIQQIVQESVHIEMVASYGMPVGREVFETVVWIGRFQQASLEKGTPASLHYRRDVKLHHCGSARAKDGNVIQALKDKYGDKGTKKAPGITYGLKKDLWQAFALATYVTELGLGLPQKDGVTV